jgi:hypothetical protein
MPDNGGSPLDRQFLIARYDRELDRKDKLTAAVGLPFTILAGLGGVLVTVAKGFTYKQDFFSIVFWVPLVADTVFVSLCLYWLARNYGGSKYSYLPRLQELEDTRSAMEEEGEVTDLFEEALRSSIISATDENAKTDDTRSAFMDRANQMLVLVLIATAFAAVLYAIDQVR